MSQKAKKAFAITRAEAKSFAGGKLSARDLAAKHGVATSTVYRRLRRDKAAAAPQPAAETTAA